MRPVPADVGPDPTLGGPTGTALQPRAQDLVDGLHGRSPPADEQAEVVTQDLQLDQLVVDVVALDRRGQSEGVDEAIEELLGHLDLFFQGLHLVLTHFLGQLGPFFACFTSWCLGRRRLIARRGLGIGRPCSSATPGTRATTG